MRTEGSICAREAKPWRGGRIVIAEDDDAMRTMLASVLRKHGFDVIESKDGIGLFEEMERSRSLSPDEVPVLVISDIRMPGCTGTEALRALRALGFRTPVIAITAFGDPETHDEVRRLGAAEILDKPFDVDDLLRRVFAVLSRSTRGAGGDGGGKED
ncbi:MAG: response regulator [Planctomycetes bacterium]|nr:response regulator [Planctomycetota bacterium]